MTDAADAELGFRALYDASFAAVLGYALRRVDQPADAADVVSEVFLVAWRRYAEVPPGDARPWLFGIARHVLNNTHRSGRRRDRLGARLRTTLARDVVPDPATGVAAWDEVRRALLQLSPDDRELLMLVGWDGLTPTEAAYVLGIAPGTARMRLARARDRFSKHWGDATTRSGHVQGDLFPLVTGELR
ncbi:RNA polymerase sigma factor [Nocardioides montaniterrae]